MKVLLIHNKDITMEYLENILEGKCIRGEVIVALPDAFTLEVMRNIHFDMVIGSIHGSTIGIMEDFLAKVKEIENENDIYTYMGVDKETLGTLDQDLLDVVDDFISIPIDREEFGYRLGKAAKRLMKRKGEESLPGVLEPVVESGIPDVSSPEMKLLDRNFQEVSIKEILQSEVVEPENMEADSLFLSDANFSSMEAESEDVGPEVVIGEPGVAVQPAEPEADRFIADILMVEFQGNAAREADESGVETEEAESGTEEIETEVEDVEALGREMKSGIIPEPSYDELLKAREIRKEKEKAESERLERIKWEKSEEAARAIAKESIPVAGNKATYGEQAVGASIIVGAGSFSPFESKDEVAFTRDEASMNEAPEDGPSYEELLKAREIRMEQEKAEKERQERLKWERIEETQETASHEAAPEGDNGTAYHEQVVRSAISGMPESETESHPDPVAVKADASGREEIPCEPSYEDLVRESELRMQKEQEESRRQSMAKKFSGFNLVDSEDEEEGASEPALHSVAAPEEHRLNSKAGTIQEEIDLLKHLRKDYNVKTSKVNTAKFKKEKKNIAAKRQKKESKSNGLVAKVTKIFVFLLLVVLTTIAVYFIREKLEGRDPVVAGYRLASLASDVWMRYFK